MDHTGDNPDGTITPSDQSQAGGKGEFAEVDQRHVRETMALIRKAVKNQWNISERVKLETLRTVARIVEEGKTEREQLRASEIIAAMHRDDLAALSILDKLERLDTGQATERVEFGPMKF